MSFVTRVTALASIFVLAVMPCFSLAAQKPKIVFENKEVYFDKVEEGKSVTADYPFENKGGMNLIIDSVTPSCGCTVPKYDKVIKPGEKGNVHLVLDTEGISGTFRKTVVVATNDPSNPYVTLVLSGETKGRIKLSTGRRLTVSGCQGRVVEAVATISDPDGGPILITGMENPMSDYLTASLKALPGGKAYRLTVRADSKEPVSFAGPLFLKMPGASKVSVFVVAQIKGPFEVQPHEVYFGAISKRAPAPTRDVLIQKACAERLVLERLVFDTDKFKVKMTWAETGAKMYLAVTPILENLPLGRFNEYVTVVTPDGEFKVRLAGMVR